MFMNKEGIAILAHLLSALKESVIKLDHALRDNDMEAMAFAKKEILKLQSQIDKVI